MAPETHSEQHLRQLLTDAGRGDTEAWGQLYAAVALDLRRWLVTRLRDGIESPRVDDIASETFARLPKAAAAFRGDSSVTTFVISIAKNVIREEDRHWDGQVQLHELLDPLEEQLRDTYDRPTAAEDPKAEHLMSTALDRLPPAQRTAVIDEYLGGRALTAGMSARQKTARRQNLSRARRRLQHIITEDETFAPLAAKMAPWSSATQNPPRQTRGA